MALFEYWHTYVVGVRQKHGENLGRIFGDRERYPQEAIEKALNEAGAEGRELITMTPDWVWRARSIENTHDYSYYQGSNYDTEVYQYNTYSAYSSPVYIAGWYLVFKRQKAT